MMMNNDINIKNKQTKIISAAIVTIFLMFLFGLSHRILAEKLFFTGEMIPIDPNALSSFPMEIDSWTGQEAPLSDAIIEATDTDAHISRSYFRNNGTEGVSLYVAFGQRARDLIPHRPEVCYVGAGWTREDVESVEIPLEDGTGLPCTLMQFSRGSLVQKNVMILDYYIVDGAFSSDVSAARWKIGKGSGAIKYIAQIQISVPVISRQDVGHAKEVISSFAIDSAPLLKQLLSSFDNKDPVTDINPDSNNISGEAGSD